MPKIGSLVTLISRVAVIAEIACFWQLRVRYVYMMVKKNRIRTIVYLAHVIADSKFSRFKLI